MVVKLNKNCKKEFLDSLEIQNNLKSLWDKHFKHDSDILLIGKDELLLRNKKLLMFSIPVFSQSPTPLIYLNGL